MLLSVLLAVFPSTEHFSFDDYFPDVSSHSEMAAGIRALLVLHRASLGLTGLQRASPCFSRQLCDITAAAANGGRKPIPIPENKSLLENLKLMGVDVKSARQRWPALLRKIHTNELAVAKFLQDKGASSKMVASVITRYPLAITCSISHLEGRWALWRNIFASDEEIVSILYRSPESFVRPSDNGTLRENINFLMSLGFHSRELRKLLSRAPRTLSNSMRVNKQMVECLKDICTEHGGDNPESFAKNVMTNNVFIMLKSTKRVKSNICILKEHLELKNHELLAMFQGPGTEILNLTNDNLLKNFTGFQDTMLFYGSTKSDVKKLIMHIPCVLFCRFDIMNSKLDCLVNSGITIQQIMEKPTILKFSKQTIMKKLKSLTKVGYGFENNSICILLNSEKRFAAKLENLSLQRKK